MNKLVNKNFKNPISIIFGANFMSNQFIHLMNNKLHNEFYRLTKIKKPTNEIFLSIDATNFAYITLNDIQKLKLQIVVINTTFKTTIAWKNKSIFGLLVRPHNTDFDENEIEMWFEDLPIEKIRKEYYKNAPKINIDESKLRYKFVLKSFFYDSIFLVLTCDNQEKQFIDSQISKIINEWNERSEKENRKYGIIHNVMMYEDEKDNEMIFSIDLGSASEKGLIHILYELNNIKSINKVLITSFL